ncbi:SPW repeat protein [Saccharomonospora sp. NPDC006951]
MAASSGSSSASASARSWTRPHDWVEVVLGAVLALSPIWMSTDNAAMWTMIVLGALIALDGLVSLAVPGLIYGEGVQVVLGALAFISPWVMTYTAFTGAAWTSWIVGGLTVIAGAAALPIASSAHRAASQH